MNEKRKTFRITVDRDSDRWCVRESEITGLFLETATWEEMLDEIRTIAPLLIRKNFSMNESDMANVEIHVSVKRPTLRRKVTPPRIFVEQEQLAAM
ncbi:MAG: hypothetical protein OXG88_07645 [Gammaproteobacteria bacterium]|nr:hypothetical protein [Gammaproteobacteria bacterium]